MGTDLQRANHFQQALAKPSFVEWAARSLPAGIDAEKYIAGFRNAVSRSQNIANCDPNDVIKEVIKACEIGLSVNTTHGHAYMLVYRNSRRNIHEPKLIVGYKGLVYLALETGDFQSIDGRVIYENDQFSITYTPKPVFQHVPTLGERGDIIGAYAYFYRKESEVPTLELLTLDDLRKIEAVSPSREGPWKNWRDQQAIKSALKRLLKDQIGGSSPTHQRLVRALEIDNENSEAFASATVRVRQPGVAGLKQSLSAPDREPVEFVDAEETEDEETPEPGSNG